jgi:AcrR family transcriptional regulator
MRHVLTSDDTYGHILDTAERLFAKLGLQKTGVADIAQELKMSPANLYRFFKAKAEINNAVGRRLLVNVEVAVDNIAKNSGSAGEKLRDAIATIEMSNAQRFTSNPKLHQLLEVAFDENWPLAREYTQCLDKSLMGIISQGKEQGEFAVCDCELAAVLVRSACIRFYHPRVMAENAVHPEPTSDQMVDFCLRALS